MTLKEKIIQELKSTGVANIDKMLQYMEQRGYYECRSHSHNNWKGGASQHMWAVYLIAKALRNEKHNEPNIAKYATDSKLALVCLLHDLCDMHVRVRTNIGEDVSGRHGAKSFWIMRNMNVGTEAEREAVRNHMHSNRQHHLTSQQEIDEYNALHSLVHRADRLASGTAWNSTRYKNNRTQRRGEATMDLSYLRAVAMDRSVQSGRKKCHFYVDEEYELREYRNYKRDKIKWNSCENVIRNLYNNAINKVQLDGTLDVISAAHKHIKETGERLCLVVEVDPEIPRDKDTRLRKGWVNEQDILICSNLLNSFYESDVCVEKGKRRYRFQFTMRDEIKKHYRKLTKEGGIFLPGVVMIRDGSSRGFPFVEPWTIDILMLAGRRTEMFAIPSCRL